ncbi:unnamed protein product [Auanema sp. JU1783]|nr:unnamed protein product [Auanema sp. JU1783]
MKKNEGDAYMSRLSSSASSIRASNYSIARSFEPSLSSYRFANYTPPTRSLGSSDRVSSYENYSTKCSSNNGSLRRSSSSTSYGRTLYQSPSMQKYGSVHESSIKPTNPYKHLPSRDNKSNNVLSTSTTYGSISSLTSSIGTNNNIRTNTTSGVRSRSSSVTPSYRTVNVAQLNKQAKERAEREEKLKNYLEWSEREKQKDMELKDDILDLEFRKVLGADPVNTNRSYSQFSRSGAIESDIGSLRSSMAKRNTLNSSTELFNRANDETPERKFNEMTISTSSACANGYTGLRNIGNTCFLNSTVQILANLIELKKYFLDGLYIADLNRENALGCQGRIAEAFADIMKSLWSGKHRAIDPVRLKELVGLKAPQFANCGQHDAHEFLSFLLDLLHEDLNRVRVKPIVSQTDNESGNDLKVSSETWNNHLLRNNSIFVDLFHGQLKSKLQCPKCDKVSITFDPFVYLPVPFPKPKKTVSLLYWPLDSNKKPIKLSLRYSVDGVLDDLSKLISEVVNVSPQQIRLIEVFGHRIQKVFDGTEKLTELCSGIVIYAFELCKADEEIVELYAIQRLLYVSSLRYCCSECGNFKGKLKACEACYNAYYCDKECQLTHWNEGHRDECRRRSQAESVGQPLVISIPKSQLNYSNLVRILDKKCRHSVNVTALQSFEDVDGHDLSNSSLVKSRSISSITSITQERTPSKKRDRQLLLRVISSQAHILGDTISSESSESEGQTLMVKSGSFLSVNWYNFRHGKPFLNVETKKTIDFDVLETESSNTTSAQAITTLEDMLEMFSETERLKPEESWYCNKCRDHVEATKKLELFRLPPILIIQLKRFVYTSSYHTMHRRSKDERRVVYPLEGLDMTSYLSDTSSTHLSTIYDLVGVVCHSGSSFFGHYISMGRLTSFDTTDTEIGWRSFDDSVVTNQPISAVQSDDAYLLFYKQRGNATRPVFRKNYGVDINE